MGASLASCWSRETPGEEPVLEEQRAGLPENEHDERPGHPGDAGNGDGQLVPAACNDPCECCYYTRGRRTWSGDYTCGWRMINGRYTWWHGQAAHGMWDKNNPHLGINKPDTAQCPCCYYRMVGGAWKGPGWYLTWAQEGYVWYGKGAIHSKPQTWWKALECDGPSRAPWYDPAPWMTAGAIRDVLEPPEMPSDVLEEPWRPTLPIMAPHLEGESLGPWGPAGELPLILLHFPDCIE